MRKDNIYWLENKDEEEAFYEQGSNRAVGVIWAAILENRLTTVLKVAMRKNDTLHKELFQSSGPLGNFGTKIRVAYMFGLIHYDVYGDLLIVKKIRNAFAHNVSVKSFEEQPIRDWMMHLKTVAVHKVMLAKLKKKLKESQEPEPDKNIKGSAKEMQFSERAQGFILEQELASNRMRYHLTTRFLIHKLVEIEKMIVESGKIYAAKVEEEPPLS